MSNRGATREITTFDVHEWNNNNPPLPTPPPPPFDLSLQKSNIVWLLFLRCSETAAEDFSIALILSWL